MEKVVKDKTNSNKYILNIYKIKGEVIFNDKMLKLG